MHMAMLAMREVHGAIDLSEQRVVLAHPDVLACSEARTTLTHEDRTGRDLLTSEALHSESLGPRVATVLCASETFLVSHNSLPALTYLAHIRAPV